MTTSPAAPRTPSHSTPSHRAPWRLTPSRLTPLRITPSHPTLSHRVPSEPTPSHRARALRVAATLLLALAATACEGDSGPPGKNAARPDVPDDPDDPAPFDTELDPGEPAPAIVISILGIEGAAAFGAPEGTPVLEPGDPLAVTFSITRADDAPWLPDELAYGQALVSGPSFNYQRVIPERDDLLTAAIDHGDGSFTYAFAGGLPSTYAAPLNDSASFDDFHGELTGEPLLAGTYTLGLFVGWDYTVDGEPFRVGGEATLDFLVGAGGGDLTPRRVTTTDHCNRCHVALEAHEERYATLTACLLCHTSGAEDLNDPDVAGGTPGVSVDSRVLFHRIHTGRHLPSVVGVAVTETGDLDYTAPSTPFLVAGEGGKLFDYSEVGFPAWPERTISMPRQLGYSALPPSAQAKNDEIHRGVTSCYVCHGDPDGTGPLEEPEQGQLHLVQPTQKVCVSCHDDVDFSMPYNGSFGQMPPLENDAFCITCHDSGDSSSAVGGGHRHPLRNTDFDPGLVIEVLSAGEGAVSDGDGRVEPGETLAVSFTLETGVGQALNPFLVGAIEAVLSGPSENPNLVHQVIVPRAVLGATQPFALELPERVVFERLGVSTGAAGEQFVTARAPHLDVFEAFTEVAVASALAGPSGALAVAAPAGEDFVDLVASGGFARDDVVVLDLGGPTEEYLRVQGVDGSRLWFATLESPGYGPALRFDHGAGTSAHAVVLQPKVAVSDFTLDKATGAITEVTEFGVGVPVLASYTTPFVLPDVYPQPAHGSPDLGEPSGEWSGKSLASGTYRLLLGAHKTKDFSIAGEVTPYVLASPAVSADLLVGDADTLQPWARIDDVTACNACHQDLVFHGGRWRGAEGCITCHGNAGMEDRPPWVAAGAPETPGVTISFRTLVHRIHRGRDLANADTFVVVGEGDDPYPDNFSVSGFGQVGFPARPGGVLDCEKCHGNGSDTWEQPTLVEHPTDQLLPIRSWTTVCAGCHDDGPAQAHMDSNTSPFGAEACAICHAPGEDEAVALVHDFR